MHEMSGHMYSHNYKSKSWFRRSVEQCWKLGLCLANPAQDRWIKCVLVWNPMGRRRSGCTRFSRTNKFDMYTRYRHPDDANCGTRNWLFATEFHLLKLLCCGSIRSLQYVGLICFTCAQKGCRGQDQSQSHVLFIGIAWKISQKITKYMHNGRLAD